LELGVTGKGRPLTESKARELIGGAPLAQYEPKVA